MGCCPDLRKWFMCNPDTFILEHLQHKRILKYEFIENELKLVQKRLDS